MRDAANILGRQITTADIAKACGVSRHTIRQSRLVPGTAGYRQPPAGWERAVAKLAKRRARELERLAARLLREEGD